MRKNFSLRPQADNFLRLLAGRLRLNSPSRKNFFAVRSYNRKNVFAIGYSIRKNFFAVGRFKPQEPLCANIVARKELSVIRTRVHVTKMAVGHGSLSARNLCLTLYIYLSVLSLSA